MAKNKLDKNITTDELAVIINKGFQSQMDYMDKKFEAVDKKFEAVDKKFEVIDEKFNKVFKVLKVMDDKLDDVGSVKHRVDYIETTLNIQPLKIRK